MNKIKEHNVNWILEMVPACESNESWKSFFKKIFIIEHIFI